MPGIVLRRLLYLNSHNRFRRKVLLLHTVRMRNEEGSSQKRQGWGLEQVGLIL